MTTPTAGQTIKTDTGLYELIELFGSYAVVFDREDECDEPWGIIDLDGNLTQGWHPTRGGATRWAREYQAEYEAEVAAGKLEELRDEIVGRLDACEDAGTLEAILALLKAKG